MYPAVSSIVLLSLIYLVIAVFTPPILVFKVLKAAVSSVKVAGSVFVNIVVASVPISSSQVFKLVLAVSSAVRAPLALDNSNAISASAFTSAAKPDFSNVLVHLANSSSASFKASAADSVEVSNAATPSAADFSAV